MTIRGRLQLELDRLRAQHINGEVEIHVWIEMLREWARRVFDAGFNPKKDFI